MPKSRKKKVKHQDFARVKLKVGKKLPKADNETDASFRSRSIQLKDQFKGDGAEGSGKTNKKKLKINEILNQCQHYNLSTKQDAVVLLREAVTHSPHFLLTHLAPIIERCSELFVDKDVQVRSAILRVLKTIFPLVPSNKISPFFPILSAHLCCAMTHIYEDVQMDSLAILDVVLEFYPQLIVTSSSQIMPNLLEQISRQGSSDVWHDKNSRSLVVNPGGKTGSSKWRVGVLKRLGTVLQTLISVRESERTSNVAHQVRDVDWENTQSHMELYTQSQWSQTRFILGAGIMSTTAGSGVLSDGESFKSYVQMLVPLLLQCWVEVGPSQLTSTLPGNALSRDALSTLSSVLCVLELLLQYTNTHLDAGGPCNMTWIQEKYEKDFCRYFMSHFPYTMCAQQGKKKQPQQVSMLSLNLAACQVMTYFLDGDANLQQPWLEQVVDYMVETKKLSSDELVTAMNVYDKLLSVSLTIETKSDLLSTLVQMYKGKHVKSADFRTLLGFLGKIYLADTNIHLRSLNVFSIWAATFPTVLTDLSSETGETLSLILSIVKATFIQNDGIFEGMFSVGEDNHWIMFGERLVSLMSREQQRLLVEMLYYIPELTRKHLQQLLALSISGALHPLVQRYMLTVLTDRFSKHDIELREFGDYLSFMFTMLLGKTGDEASVMETSGSEESLYDVTITHNSSTARIWNNHCTRLEYTLAGLEQSRIPADATSQLWVEFYLSDVDSNSLDLVTVVSVLNTTSRLVMCADKQEKFITRVVHIILAALSYCVQDSSVNRPPTEVTSCLPEVTANISEVTSCLPEVTANMSEVTANMSEVTSCVLTSCIQCLGAVDGLWLKLIDIVTNISQNASMDTVCRLLLTLKPVCTSELLRDVIRADYDKLLVFMEHIKVLHPELATSESYCTIWYHTSLLSK